MSLLPGFKEVESGKWKVESLITSTFRLFLVIFFLFITYHLSLITGDAHAAPGQPNPMPCDGIKTDKLTDNYVTNENGEPPFVEEVSKTGKPGDTVTIQVITYFQVDFSKLQAVFGISNSDYLEGKFQDEEHRTSNLLDLKSAAFNLFHGAGQKTTPKTIVDDLKVKYVEYVYNKPTLPEAANKYTDLNGQNAYTIYELISPPLNFPYPPNPPEGDEDRTQWLEKWGKYWEKIPTAYSEFYTGFLEFYGIAGDKKYALIKEGLSCVDITPVRPAITFVMPEFWRTTSISDQLNQVVVPCAAQSWRHGVNDDNCGADLTDLENRYASAQPENLLSKTMNLCKNLIKGPPKFLLQKLQKVVQISLNFVKPIKNVYAADPPPADGSSCIKILTPGKEGNAPYCALPETSLMLGDACINKVSENKLDKENPNVICTFYVSWEVQQQYVIRNNINPDPTQRGNDDFDSCEDPDGDGTFDCKITVRIWPVFRIPYLSEIWNNTLYSNEEEGAPNAGVGSRQESGRPGIYSSFTPKAIYSKLFPNKYEQAREAIEDCKNGDSQACEAAIPALFSCIGRTFTLVELLSKPPDELGDILDECLANQLAKNLPGQVASNVAGAKTSVLGANSGDAKERFIGATDCNKFFTRDIALKPKALQEELGINSQQCNLQAAAIPDGGGGGGGGGSGDLTYYIEYGNTSTMPAMTKQDLTDQAELSGWVPNNINTHYNDVINQSISHGISPAFSIAIWWEEGGFGGAGANSEFGCFPGGDTTQVLSFNDSFSCFLSFTATEHPYDSSSPQSSFTEWARYFCGTITGPICSNNPGFIDRLESIYNTVAPGEIIYVSD